MINIVFIAIIWVFIMDVSGFAYDAREFIGRKLHVKPEAVKTKPLFCSLCLSFWTGLIYLICTGQFTIPMIAFVLLVACSTTLIKDVYFLIFDSLQAVLAMLSKKINKSIR